MQRKRQKVFWDLVKSVSEHYISLHAFHQQRCKSFRSLLLCGIVWIFMARWRFLFWPHRDHPPPLPRLAPQLHCTDGYSPSPFMWHVRREHKVTENFPKDRLPAPQASPAAPAPAEPSGPSERTHPLSPSLTPRHKLQGWVMQSASRGRGLNSVRCTSKCREKSEDSVWSIKGEYDH